MSKLFSCTFQNVSVAALQDLFELTAADDEPARLVGCVITQGSDMGDAEEEGLRIAIIRGNATSGSGGSPGSEVNLDPKGGAASVAVELNNTTEASTGTESVIHEEQVNSRVGFHYWPPEKARPKFDQSGLLVVRLLTAPADALSVSGTIYWEEL